MMKVIKVFEFQGLHFFTHLQYQFSFSLSKIATIHILI